MKREIKFRGKRVNGSEWAYGMTISNGTIKRKTNDVFFEIAENKWVGLIPETLGQFTGLKDKNGKEIYEGDILHFTAPDGSIRHFVVEWATEDRKLMSVSGFEHNGFDIRISGWCFNWNGMRLYPNVIDGIPDNEEMFVVGNIHDNPELIK